MNDVLAAGAKKQHRQDVNDGKKTFPFPSMSLFGFAPMDDEAPREPPPAQTMMDDDDHECWWFSTDRDGFRQRVKWFSRTRAEEALRKPFPVQSMVDDKVSDSRDQQALWSGNFSGSLHDDIEAEGL